MAGGRKTLKEEMQLVHRMAELSGPVFKFINKCLNSKKITEQKWATEQMMKLYSRSVPMGFDPQKPLTVTISGMKIIYEGENGNRVPDKKPEATAGE